VPYEDLEVEGYGQYKKLFDGPKDAGEALQ